MVDKQSIINLSNYSSKSYAFVVLCNFKVIFLGKGENATFLSISLLYFVYRQCHIIEEVCHQIPCLP